jgi:cutinase
VVWRCTKYVSIDDVSARQIACVLGAAVVTTLALLNAAVSIPSTLADPCPDIEVVSARGSGDPPGVGWVGEAFVDSLRSQVGGRSVGVYAVNYPSTHVLSNPSPHDLSNTASAGAANCPNTRMVLVGYSLGAAVIDVITSAGVPLPFGLVPAPMPPKVADHVAAVAVFGNPSSKGPGGPLTAISPLYGAKAIDLCMPSDPACSDGENWSAHGQYVQSGMVRQAATFAASRL